MPRPTIILVPGMGHSSSCFSLLISHLSASNYVTQAIDLPSNGASPAHDSDAQDVAAIRAALVERIEGKGEDVVLVAHSAGGVSAGEAVESLSKRDRAAKGMHGGVVAIVYIAAFVPDVGDCIVFLYEAELDERIDNREDGLQAPKDPAMMFYNDLPADVAQEHVARLVTGSPPLMSSKATSAP